jgi:uncharacterized protein YggE
MKRLAILLGLMLLTALSTSAVVEEQQGIRVVGEGTATVPADTVIISVGVQSTNANTAQAAAENADRLNKTIDALTKAGVQKDEIMPGQSSGVMSNKVEIYNAKTANNKTTWENVSRDSNVLTNSITIQLKTTDISRINSTLEAAKSQGAVASIEGYSISDPKPAESAARDKAIDNARSNAADMASAAGVSLGKAIDIEDYGFPDIRMNEPLGPPATSLGTISVTSYVMVTYAIA